MSKIDEAIEAAWQKSHFNEGYYDPNYPIKASNNFADGFKAGMKFALTHQWRSVDEDGLPKPKDYDNAVHSYIGDDGKVFNVSAPFVVYIDYKNEKYHDFCTAVFRVFEDGRKRWELDYDYFGLRDEDNFIVRYWMPMPSVPQRIEGIEWQKSMNRQTERHEYDESV